MGESFKKLLEKIRYRIDQAFARKFFGQLLLFLIMVTTVTLVGVTAMYFGLFSEANRHIQSIPREIDSGFWDSVWWSLNQVMRLQGFERTYGASAPVLAYSLFLSVMGLIVFSVLISLINNTMRARIEALRKGDTAVVERGHVLVLGWSNKVFSVLKQLARLHPGATAVILAPRDVDMMQEQLRIAGIYREPIKIILRSGTPSNHGELDRVAVREAAGVVILATDADDSEAIKTMVLLTSRDDWPGTPPVLVSEIALEQHYELAKIAARNQLHIVSSSLVISKVIVQTVRNPGLADVYSEIFSTAGNSLYVQAIPECTDRTFGEVAFGLQDAVPLGITWDEDREGRVRHAAGLNPEPDYDIDADEQLVLLTKSLPVTFSPTDNIPESGIWREGGMAPHVPNRVLVIGWSGLIYDIVQEFDAHALRGTEVTILSAIDAEEGKKRMVSHGMTALKNLTTIFVQGDAVQRTAWEGVDLEDFPSVVVLAEESAAQADADSRSLRVLLRLSDLRQQHATRPHTVLELLDESNRALFAGLGVDDLVVSPEVVSAQLAQVARQAVLAPIHRELLSAGGVEISLRPARDYVELDVPCRFSDLIYSCQRKLETALGLRLSEAGGQVLLNPPRDAEWRLGEDDKVIVLAQQVYR